MTHLRIELNNIQENVSSTVIEKLYLLATSGDLDASSNLAGNIHTTATYLEYIDALCKTLLNPDGMFEDLTITATKYYMKFNDPEFERICVANFSSDGIGCVVLDLTLVTSNVPRTLFNGNTSITDATEFKYFSGIPSLAESISGTFNGCTNLIRVELPDQITSLRYTYYNNYAGWFNGCTKLEYVKLPTNLTILAANTFYGCSSLTNIDLSNTNITRIESDAFTDSGLLTITIPNTVTIIQSGVFDRCSQLTNISFDLSNGQDLSISGSEYYGVPILGSGIPVTRIEFPSRLKSIGAHPFRSSNLTTIIFNSLTPPTVSNDDLGGTESNVRIYVPDSAVSTWKQTAPWSTYENQIYSINSLPQS